MMYICVGRTLSTSASACTVYPYILVIKEAAVMSSRRSVTELTNISLVMSRYTSLHVAFTLFRTSTMWRAKHVGMEMFELSCNNQTFEMSEP